tara:strand:- start:12151 stop:12717 length:567 start_codon:yes stop_codon:yes gene_type:complete
LGVLIAYAFVQAYSQHEQYPQANQPHEPPDPVCGAFGYNQENNRKEYHGRPLVPDAHIPAGVLYLAALQLPEHKMVLDMIRNEQHDKPQFYLHPRSVNQPGGHMQHDQPKNHRKHHGWPGDDKPEPFCHKAQLFVQDALFRFGLLVGLNLINKQAGDVEQSRKPRDDKDEVQRFYVQVAHGTKIAVRY